ncbi:9895_t:CDS:2, partial [Acaulospora colombiana]
MSFDPNINAPGFLFPKSQKSTSNTTLTTSLRRRRLIACLLLALPLILISLLKSSAVTNPAIWSLTPLLKSILDTDDMSTLDTNPGSNNAEGWHTRATESTSVTASSFDPKAEDLLATFFYSTKGSGDGFTMALMKPNIAVDAAGRILTLSSGDFVGLQEVVDAVKPLPQTDEWRGQWRIKQDRTCFGFDRIQIPGQPEISIYGWVKPKEGMALELESPAKGFTHLPQELGMLVKLAREAREGFTRDQREESVVQKILAFKDEAKRWEERHRTDDIMVYTDGSGFEGNIGAAAVLYRNGQMSRHLQYHLGTDKEHTVYEGELVGIILGLHLIKGIKGSRPKATVNLDNQAAIISTLTNKPQPGAYLLDEVNRLATQTQEMPLKFTWIPGHSDIPGNDEADERAKEAAQGTSSETRQLPPLLRKPLPFSVSALRQDLRARIETKRRVHWAKSPRYYRLNNIDPKLPSSHFRKLTRNLSRTETSILIQLRTNHLPLNAHLHRIKKIEHPFCRYCQGETIEDVNHFLFVCPQYTTARLDLRRKLGRQVQHLKTLLAAPKAIKHTLEYIRQTKRLQNYMSRLENKQRTSVGRPTRPNGDL